MTKQRKGTLSLGNGRCKGPEIQRPMQLKERGEVTTGAQLDSKNNVKWQRISSQGICLSLLFVNFPTLCFEIFKPIEKLKEQNNVHSIPLIQLCHQQLSLYTCLLSFSIYIYVTQICNTYNLDNININVSLTILKQIVDTMTLKLLTSIF